jgi:mRNA interferase RelE/StbE
LGWKTELIPSVIKDLKKMDKQAQKQIVDYLKELIKMPNPLTVAKKLTNNDFYRFRCGDYRIICKIINEELIILVILISHRKNVYSELNRRIK